jgi:hypothetical protein
MEGYSYIWVKEKILIMYAENEIDLVALGNKSLVNILAVFEP